MNSDQANTTTVADRAPGAMPFALGSPLETYATRQTGVSLALAGDSLRYSDGVFVPSFIVDHHDSDDHSSGNVAMAPRPSGAVIPRFGRPPVYWDGACMAEGGDMPAYVHAFSPVATASLSNGDSVTSSWPCRGSSFYHGDTFPPQNGLRHIWNGNTLHSHGGYQHGGPHHDNSHDGNVWEITNFPDIWDGNTHQAHWLPPHSGVPHSGHDYPVLPGYTPLHPGVFPDSCLSWQDSVSLTFSFDAMNQDSQLTHYSVRLGTRTGRRPGPAWLITLHSTPVCFLTVLNWQDQVSLPFYLLR